MRWRRPEGLFELDADVGTELARLGAIEGFARSVITGVVPLAALEALGSKQAVSKVFIGGAVITLLFTLNVGTLERRLQRRWVINLAAGFLLVAVAMFTFVEGPLFAVAIGLRSAEASMFSVCLSLYIMNYIGKKELKTTESQRIVYTGGAWLVGPTVGVWMFSHGAEQGPFIVAAVSTLLMLAYFWRLRWHHNAVLLGPTTAPTKPIQNIVRFFKQKNMRIAYSITVSRAVFWAALFVYGPLYVVEAGLPTWMAGGMLSAASGMLFISPVVRRSADRWGTRTVIISSCCLIAACMIGLAVLRTAQPVGVVFWLGGALGGAALDVLGNIPFMRTVKPRERTAMTTVFSTWRELSFLLTPLIAVGALALDAFWLLYVVVAAMLIGAAVATTFLPRRI
ncbi:MAG: MFS transporter [Ilumatobacteraceae bacterium]